MLIKNRVRDKKSNKIIGYERINVDGHWEHIRVRRQTYLLGCITSEDSLEREPFIGLLDTKGEELYLKDKVKLYVNDSYGWRPGTIVWDDTLLMFFWVSATNICNGETLRTPLAGNNNLATLKFLL